MTRFKVLSTIATVATIGWTSAALAEGQYVHHHQAASVLISYVGVEKAVSVADGAIHLEAGNVNLFLPHAWEALPIGQWDNRGLTIDNDGRAPGLNCIEAAMSSVAGRAFTQVNGNDAITNRGFPFVIALIPNFQPSDIRLTQDGTLHIKRGAIQSCGIQLPVI